jgi:hypothetical protein
VSSDKDAEHWWYNMKTKQAEFGRQVSSLDRIGPFATKAEAELALENARARAQAWAAEEESEG